MTRRSPEGAFSAGDLPHRSSEELRELNRRADEVIEAGAVRPRRGASSYIGADADGNPSGFARHPTFSAGEVPPDRYFPVQCLHCMEVLHNLAEFQTHMRNEHPA